MSTEAIAGANNKLNSIKGFSRVLSVSAEEKVAFADKVFPRNILIKADDGDLYLTDGVTALGELEPLKVQSSRDDIGRVISETYATKAELGTKADKTELSAYETKANAITGLAVSGRTVT